MANELYNLDIGSIGLHLLTQILPNRIVKTVLCQLVFETISNISLHRKILLTVIYD